MITFELLSGIFFYLLMSAGFYRLFPKAVDLSSRILFVLIAMACSIATCSVAFFDSLFISSNNSCSLIIIAIISILPFVLRRFVPTQSSTEGTASDVVKVSPILMALALLAVLLSLAYFVLYIHYHPQGDWDGIMVHNLRARFIARAALDWKTGFSSTISWSNPDYPILVPSFIAWLWKLSGNQNALTLNLVTCFFPLATALTLFLSLWILRLRNQALLALTVYLSTTLVWTASGCCNVDVPVSLFLLLANLSLFCVDMKKCPRKSGLVFAGFMFGAMIWTKNDGLILTLAIVVSRLLVQTLPAKHKIQSIGNWLKCEPVCFALGALPALSAFIFLKRLSSAILGPVSSQSPAQLLLKLSSPERWATTLLFASSQLVNFGKWLISPVPLLLFYVWLYRRKLLADESRVFLSAVIALLIVIVLEDIVYVVSPSPFFVIAVSSGRLILQLWPSVLLAMFYCVEVPPPVLKSPRSRQSSAAG